jgi:hypothetical protein
MTSAWVYRDDRLYWKSDLTFNFGATAILVSGYS